MKLRIVIALFLALSSFSFWSLAHAYAPAPDPLLKVAQPLQDLLANDPSSASRVSSSVVGFVSADRNEDGEFPRRFKAAFTGLPATANSPQAFASAGSVSISALDKFIVQVHNGQPGVIAGVYVSDVLALKVVRQPANDSSYISLVRGTATLFGLAAKAGTVGLLAHNYSSGELFFDLAAGQEADIVYGDGAVQRYRVSGVRHFQALSSTDPYSNLLDLDNGNISFSSSDVFNQVYGSGNAVVFQTCIKANGNLSWGRLFVTATPIP